MLTHDDIVQLRGVIREEVEAEGKAVRREFVVANTQVKADFIRIADRLKPLEIETAKTHEVTVGIACRSGTAALVSILTNRSNVPDNYSLSQNP